ncbi:DNA-binding protein [Rhodococcus spelaei]|uniref:DNA-binding protein n=1 Tax=Rhodococcus spelaei TaxID=2546320 RepID=A0A541B8U7_9NOCA|nr:OB-fold domain-containing protein [Rhodococcus spelaei]TQF68741.1 DNA-binding protein [Rhodococcus spelaei]
MVHGQRALPELTELTEAHWTSGASGRLSVQRCASCLRWSFPPTPCCRHCWRTDLRFEPVTGKGVLLSWTRVAEAVRPAPAAPYVVAVVDLEEGVRLLLNLVGATADELRVDAPVRLRFVQVDAEVWLPIAEIEELEEPEDELEAVS